MEGQGRYKLQYQQQHQQQQQQHILSYQQSTPVPHRQTDSSTQTSSSSRIRSEHALLDSPAILNQMLAQCRTVKLPKMRGQDMKRELAAHINAYNKLLLRMPALMDTEGVSVRPHLLWKHMLALSADDKVQFGQLTSEGLRSMSPEMSKELPAVPSWLPPGKLASQLNCEAQFVLMWARLWKHALQLPGASAAVFSDTAGISQVLDNYLSEHNCPPSPHVLMSTYLKVPVDIGWRGRKFRHVACCEALPPPRRQGRGQQLQAQP